MTRSPHGKMKLHRLWHARRPLGQIIRNANAGTLPRVEPLATGYGDRVANPGAALAAMRG